MKKIFTLITLAIAGLFQNANAQIQNHYIYGDSLIGCQNSLSGYIANGPLAETVNVEISWGDGSTDNIPVAIAANSYGSFMQTHTYAVPGNYAVDIQFYSTVNAAYFGTGEQSNLLAYSQTSCGHFYANVFQTTPNVWYEDVPLDCTGADGITTTITPAAGFYYGYMGLDPGNAPYTVSVNDAWLTTNGYIQATADQTITSFDANGLANNSQMSFELTCSVAAQNPDFSVNYIWPSNFVAPLQTGNLYAYVCNNACSDTSDAAMTLNFPAGFTPNTSGLTNPVVTGNTLTFDIPGLTNCVQLTIPFTFPGNTPAGTSICFDLTASHPNDSDLSNNADSTCGTVLNSYDPNAKEVNHAEQIDAAVQENLEYMIHFQNDGNYSAVNVEVVDTLSENLDLSTFRLLGADHSVSFNIDPATRIVKFIFNSIYLAPSSQDLSASQGYVIYEIKETAGLGLGDEIENTAYIYFDYNPAIVTNTTYNVNSALGIKDELKETISLYPNPTSSKFQISGTDLEEIRIFDMTGKEVQYTKLLNTNSVDVQNLSNGVYTCVISSKTTIYQQKLTIKK
jgi:uncharacterized repeat protein (TIGR01451 family)